MKCDPTAPPRYPAFTLYSSPSTAGTPLTPTSETSFADPLAALDFYDLCNPEVIGMSPQRGALHHSASYTYGAPVDGQYPNGFSQERSTVSPAHSTTASNVFNPPPWPPKTLPLVMTPNGHEPSSMLPPLRDFSFWTYQGHQHSAYQYPYPVNQTRGQPFSHFNHAPHHSVSSTATNAIYTPSSTGYTSFLNPSTIQPSAFQGWQNVERDGRARSNTVSGSLFGGEHPGSRSMERSFSSPNICQDDRRSDKLMVSPSISEQQSEESWEDKQIQVIYITDADIKQTQELRRMCWNCDHTSPPSWRKSLLAPGKILCNRCGIYERTHNRMRPSADDDGNLRRSGGSYRREPPPALQVMKEEEMDSPFPSPDSAAPSQATPLSATTSFTYPIAAPAQVSYKTNPDQPLLSTSALPDRRHQWAYVHTPNTAHGQGQYPRNPYAYAYSQRRSASYNTTPSHSSRASIRGTRQALAGSTSGSTGGSATWDMVRRHSDTAPHENGDADGH